LGYDVGAWIESHIVVPDGYLRGHPYKLTDEMWQFLIWFYRLYPFAEPWPAPDALRFTGAQLRRSQKWGKDPFGAAIILAEALGPTRFDGWTEAGEPVGAPYPTPLIVCLGTSEEQTANTWRPLLEMIRLGPLINLPGMDAGQTRVHLLGGGTIEPVTTSARARLGAPLTFLTITESHLFALQGGFRKVCGAVKRNVAGMDGRWLELTNAFDPTEGSEAQVTAESDDTVRVPHPDDDPDPHRDARHKRVLVDNIPSKRVEDLSNDDELYSELLRQYAHSARERGGWVNIKGRIMSEVRSSRHLEADRRRFFLNEIVIGESVFIDPIMWDVLARPDELPLRPKDLIALGFDGSKYRDATALVASRLSDGKLFTIKIWERPANADEDWKVPSTEVDETVRNVFAAYRVACMFADPYRWQDYIDNWAQDFDNVVEFATNVEQRMDREIERFNTSFAGNDIKHDGNEILTRHMKAAVLVKAGRKKPRPGDENAIATHYYKLAKRADGMHIDGAVASVLAHAARGHAIEKGLQPEEIQPFFAAWR